jgi:phosphatidylinositol-3-phosphatase
MSYWKVQSVMRKLLAGMFALFLLTTTAASYPLPPSAAKPVSPLAHPAEPAASSKTPWPQGLPVYDHIVIVVEENKDYDQIIGAKAASYINGTLKKEGANLLTMYAEEHHSEGNYFWLFSGSNQDVGFADAIPAHPIAANNLGAALLAAGHSFKGYAEDLPAIGSPTSESGAYARKHAPWLSFSNLPNGTTPATSSSLRFTDFPSDYRELPTVAIVVPNLDHDMHDGSVRAGDKWLQKHLDGYYQWAKEHNSLLILTFDESEHGKKGLTDPAAAAPEDRNRIVTILAGAHVKPGDYEMGAGATHVNLLRTLEAMYNLEPSGAQQQNAAAAGITNSTIITGVFTTK